jgi:hypothetical protein
MMVIGGFLCQPRGPAVHADVLSVGSNGEMIVTRSVADCLQMLRRYGEGNSFRLPCGRGAWVGCRRPAGSGTRHGAAWLLRDLAAGDDERPFEFAVCASHRRSLVADLETRLRIRRISEERIPSGTSSCTPQVDASGENQCTLRCEETSRHARQRHGGRGQSRVSPLTPQIVRASWPRVGSRWPTHGTRCKARITPAMPSRTSNPRRLTTIRCIRARRRTAFVRDGPSS